EVIKGYRQWETKILSVLLETTSNLATRAIGTPLSSSKGTMWCLFDPTPSGWCKTDAHSMDFARNWLERLPAGSISTWEDLTTRFLAQFFPLGRTAKLRNDILMFRKHQGESLSEAWTRFKDLLQKVPHHDIDCWLQIQNFYDHQEEINGRMTEMFVLLKELTTSRAPEKVLMREEAKHPVTKNVKSISLIKERKKRTRMIMQRPAIALKDLTDRMRRC
ncbi:zinc finger, CCHC-type containing protein, partial [Tanacetum coccineum]